MRCDCLLGASSHVVKRHRPHTRHALPSCRSFSTTVSLNRPDLRPQRVAILGGGITGLSTAHSLLKARPNAQITIYEASDRLGGWINSERVKVSDGDVLFEWGPRNLRPDLRGSGGATAHLVQKLNVDLVGIPKDSLAARNRFIYFPDHIVRLPGPIPAGQNWQQILQHVFRLFKKMLSEPVFSGVFAVLKEPWVRLRSPAVQDESVGDFITRRFGAEIADNLLSAVFHGIYAGDIYNLSARTLLPQLWYLETRDSQGSGILPEFAELLASKQALLPQWVSPYQKALREVGEDLSEGLDNFLKAQSVYTFPHGLSQLVRAAEDVLRQSPNVNFRLDSRVTHAEFDKKWRQIALHTDKLDGEYDYVVSTLPPSLLESSSRARSTSDPYSASAFQAACASASDASTVMVVNLYYTDPDLLSPDLRGFGYLLPRSVALESNPERALGVIFSSESSGLRGSRTDPAALDSVVTADEILDEIHRKHSFTPTEGPLRTLKGGQEWRKYEELYREKKRHMRILEGIVQELEEVDPCFGASEREKLQEKGWLQVGSQTPKILGQDTAMGTKLTVMLGGHWWEGWNDEDIPTAEEAIQMSKAVLARHLGIFEQPEVAMAKLAKNAIPQYRVGYRRTMATIHDGLMQQFQGRLKVAGPWYQGAVGINDCVRKAYMTAYAIAKGDDASTGLEEYGDKEKWYLADLKTMSMKLDAPDAD